MKTNNTPAFRAASAATLFDFAPRGLVRALLPCIASFALLQSAHASVVTWVGNTSANLIDANWNSNNTNTTTSTGDSWVFGSAGSQGATLNNNLAANFSVAGITFNSGASAFTINGNAITLSTGITNNSASLQTINTNIALSGVNTFTASNGGNIVLGGTISGAQNVTFTNTYVAGTTPTGTVTLSASNTYGSSTTTTTVAGGGLVLNSNDALGASGTLSLAPANNNVGSTVWVKIGSGVTITGKTITLGSLVGTAASATLQAGTSGSSTWDGNIIAGQNGKTLNLNASFGGDLVIGAVGAGRTINMYAGTLRTDLAGNVIINSVITGTATIYVNNAGSKVTLTSANSDFTSTSDVATINGGTLAVTKLANVGVGANSSLGSGAGAITSNGGALQYIGTGDTSNRVIKLNGSSMVKIDQSGTGLLKLTADLAFNQTTQTHGLTLQGSTAGTGEFSGAIANAGTFATAITKAGTGLWALSGTGNSYTGVTTITGGTLAVMNLVGGGTNSSIGASTNAASNLLLGNGATLQYIGAGGSTDRLFTINGAAAGDSATLDASGSGAINFTNTGSLAYGTTKQTRTLVLSGTSTADNTLAATIADNGTGGAVSVTKSGAGKWILSSTSTYTGATTVNSGILAIGSTGNINTTSGVSIGAGEFKYNSTTALSKNITFSTGGKLSGTGTISTAVNLTSGNTIAPGNSVGTLTLGSLTLNTGSILDFEFNANPANDQIIVSSSNGLTINGGGFNLYQEGTTNPWTTSGTYNLIGYTGAVGGTGVSSLSVSNPNGAKSYSFGLSGGYVTLTITDKVTATSTTYTLTSSAAASRIMTGGSTAISTVIYNAGTGTADTLGYSGLGATVTSGSISGATGSGSALAQGASGTASQIFTGSTLGLHTITPTVTSATNTIVGGTATLSGTTDATVTVVDNRVITSSTVNLGNVLVHKTASGTALLSSTGSHANYTDVTILSGTTSAGGVNVVSTGAQTFNGTTTSGSLGVSGTFASSGVTSGSVSVTPTGEGLAGESVQNVNVGYTATVYDVASVTASNGGRTLTNSGTGSLVASAKVESNTINSGVTQNASSWSPSTPTIASGSSATVATFDSTNRLNGTYVGSATISVKNVATDGSAITGGTSGDVLQSSTYALSVTVGGKTNSGSAEILAGQKYSGYSLGSSSLTYATTASIVDSGAASATTDLTMALGNPGAGSMASLPGGKYISSNVLELSGVKAGDLFVLQMTYSNNSNVLNGDPYYIGWYDVSLGHWVNAVATSGGTYYGTGVITGTYNSATDFALGKFGYDATTHTAWAVLDTASGEFAVIPEPSTWAMLVGGLGMLAFGQRIRRRTGA